MRKFLLLLLIAVPAAAQTSSGNGFPPYACVANYLNQNYHDTLNDLSYKCSNISGVGYTWQMNGSPVFPVTADPTGNSCTNGFPLLERISTGVVYSCQSGVYGAINGGSSGSGTVNSGTTGQIAYYAGNGTAVSGTSTPTSTFWDQGGQVFNVKAYGALGTERITESNPFNGAGHGGTMTSGNATLTCTDCAFTSSDVGLYAVVTGASSSAPYVLVAKINSVTDSSHAVLASNATTSVSGARTGIGPDDYPGVAAAMAACSATKSGTVFFPEGYYLLASTHTLTQATGCSIQGAGPTTINNLGSGNPPDEATFFPSGGSWIDSAGATAITGTEIRQGNLSNFGLMNCGIGLTGTCFLYGSSNTVGVALSKMQNVIVHGSYTGTASQFTGTGLVAYNVEHFDTDRYFSDYVNSGANLISNPSAGGVGWCGYNSKWTHFYTHPNGHSVANGNNAYAGLMATNIGNTTTQCNFWYIDGGQVNDTSGDGTGFNAIVTGTSGNWLNSLVWQNLDFEGNVNAGCLSINYVERSQFRFNECDSPYYVYHQGNDNSNLFITLSAPSSGVFGETNGGNVYNNRYEGLWNQANLYGFNYAGNARLASTVNDNYFWSSLNGTTQTAATSGAGQNSPTFNLSGNYWNGSASAKDTWQLYSQVGNGANPGVSLILSHSGSSGTASVNIPYLVNFAGGTDNISASGDVNLGAGFYVNGAGSLRTSGMTARNSNDWILLTGTRTAASGFPAVKVTNGNSLNATDLMFQIDGSAKPDWQYNGTQDQPAPIVAKGTQSVSGCSLTSAVGGTWAGQFTSGTSGTCTVTITPGITAPNGFSCWANDITTPADKLQQTVASTTAPQISGTTVSGDVITWGCVAY